MQKSFFVRPRNLQGSTQHYFHLLFGYLIPFLENVPKGDGNLYLFRDCGPVMNEIILNMPGYNIGIFNNDKVHDAVEFKGYDSPEFPDMNMERTRDMLINVFGVSSSDQDLGVLVVDRASPHSFYEGKWSQDWSRVSGGRCEIPGSGSSRRSVPNMHDVFESISRFAPAHFVHLEGMSLKDQIDLFSKYRCFVLQHGAAMSNLLFARKGSALLEIRDDFTEDYFAKMKLVLNLRYRRIRQENCHSEVDPKEVAAQIARLMRPPISLL
jgi:hypothetical protein